MTYIIIDINYSLSKGASKQIFEAKPFPSL